MHAIDARVRVRCGGDLLISFEIFEFKKISKILWLLVIIS